VANDSAISILATVARISAFSVYARQVLRAFIVTLAAFFYHWLNYKRPLMNI
jgi:hypothetical protein